MKFLMGLFAAALVFGFSAKSVACGASFGGRLTSSTVASSSSTVKSSSATK